MRSILCRLGIHNWKPTVNPTWDACGWCGIYEEHWDRQAGP